MGNVPFTRDEVILALDVLYCAGEERLTAQSAAILELSDLLNRLPIHPVSARGEIFRNPHGVWEVISVFRNRYKTRTKDRRVSRLFFDTADEFSGRFDELHAIANAIRMNMDYYPYLSYGSQIETDGFPEGALLGHLHRTIEKRDGEKLESQTRCTICQIETEHIYQNSLNLITMHLTIPVTMLEGQRRYRKEDFIPVCPNCHAALHRYRPWLTKDACGTLLR